MFRRVPRSIGFCALLLPALATDARALSSELLMSMTGTGQGDNFGYGDNRNVDFNGDGFTDIIVGACTNNTRGEDAGSAYLYLGGPALDSNADFIFVGEGAGDQFGRSFGPAGDINGDGYGDLVIGAWHNQAGGWQAGRAYVYWGGPAADTVADFVLTGSPNTAFGHPVFGLGDFSGDGYDDLFVGAGAYRGAAHVFFGGPGADTVADLTFEGEGDDDEFGWHAAPAGDVNGDGYPDVIVGAYLNDAAGSNAGRAYVYFGGPGADAVADLVVTGENAGDDLGWGVCGPGDVNGDGFDDVMASAYMNSANGLYSGRAYVYFGAEAPDNVADIVISGEQAVDRLGEWISEAGDLDGDGYAEMMVAVPGTGGTWHGQVNIYRGGPGADNVADLVVSADTTPGPFGYALAPGADVDGDGLPEIVIGAPNEGGTGAAYVFDIFGGPGETPRGGGIRIRPVDQATGLSPVSLWYQQVNRAGLSRLVLSSVGPPPPPMYRHGAQPRYYDLTSTAEYEPRIDLEVMLPAGFADPSRVRLFHWNGGSWVDVTTDQAPPVFLRGRVESLSTFALFEPLDTGQTSFLVKPDGTGDFPTIQAAVNAIANGDSIILADGVFTGAGNRNVTFLAPDPSLPMNFTILSLSGDPARCTIDLEGSVDDPARAFTLQGLGSYSSFILSGVTVTGGYASQGGAIYSDYFGFVRLENCVLTRNVATGEGGALFMNMPNLGPGLEIDRTLALENEAARGGAIYYRYYAQFEGYGSVTVTGSRFQANRASSEGGAIYLFCPGPGIQGWYPTFVLFAGCQFDDNHTLAPGGGSALRGMIEGYVDLRNCTAFGNGRPGAEGPVVNLLLPIGYGAIASSILAQNQTEATVGPIYAQSFTGPHFFVTCTDVFGNSGGDWVGNLAGMNGVSGNFSANPLFCDPASGDLTLAQGSPCLHAPGCDRIGALGEGCLVPIDAPVDTACVVTPTLINFGRMWVPLDQSAVAGFLVWNAGTVPLSGDVSESCDYFEILSGGGPFHLLPGESFPVEVRFHPTVVGDFSCLIDTGCDDCPDVPCTGSGEDVIPIALAVDARWTGRAVEVSWIPPGDQGADDFEVQRSEQDGEVVFFENAMFEHRGSAFVLQDGSVEPGRTYTYRVTRREPDGLVERAEAVVRIPWIPNALLQNQPNPFVESTEISFALATESRVRLEILNVQGRLVRVLLDGKLDGGFHSREWDGRDSDGAPVPDGFYFYRLIVDDGPKLVGKALLLK